MLNRSKVAEQLAVQAHEILIDITPELIQARKVWDYITTSPGIMAHLQARKQPWSTPIWHEELAHTFSLSASAAPYTVIATDGSQIYPDRHQGFTCFLINIGTIELAYGHAASPVRFNAIPYIFTSDSDEFSERELSAEIVNSRRAELELLHGLQIMQHYSVQDSTKPLLFLFDGSLIFWHLESKEREVKTRFLISYLALLQQFYEQRLLLAGYISLPKSKELVNIIRCALEFDIYAQQNCISSDHLVDTHIAAFMLTTGQRSIVFGASASIIECYPPHLRPYFMYIDIGYEIVRIEVPAWIATNAEYVDRVSTIIIDQVQKGHGYPVALAEAHEAAVVKGADRDFFYYTLQKLAREKKYRYLLSQKSVKKKIMAI